MPAQRSAWAGAAGALASASAYSRPSTPVVCRASASAPAKGPRPTASAVIVAQTSSGTERRVLSKKLNGARQRGRASSRPAAAASSVPTTEMASVSQTPLATRASQSADRSGGKKPATNSPIERAASLENSAPKPMSSSRKLAAPPRTMAVPTSPLRQPNGDGRAAGGVSSARRSQPDRPSAAKTRAMKVSRMEAASPPLSIFIAWSINWPRPPAPTKPMTTEARMAHSQR